MTEDYEKYDSMAEWIVTHASGISPEYVGEQLAEATADINTWLHGEERGNALKRRADARGWLRGTAERHGFLAQFEPSVSTETPPENTRIAISSAVIAVSSLISALEKLVADENVDLELRSEASNIFSPLVRLSKRLHIALGVPPEIIRLD